MDTKSNSLIVLSGGQDSVTTLYKAARETKIVGAVHFRYGQKHAVETECAEFHARKLSVELHQIDVPAFAQIGHSALLKDGGSVNEAHPTLSHLPASFVPGRNLIFLTLAAALAMKLGADSIWTGVCEEDYAGYPDCRQKTLDALEASIRVGMDFPDLCIVAPLIAKTKARTFELAQQLGVLDTIVHFTHTCYNGNHETFHDWGYGCGSCPSCQTRAAGWEQFQQERGGS